MDADTTSTVDDGMTHRQPEDAVSSTTEDERPVMSVAEGSDTWVEADYKGNEGTCNKSCLVSVTLTYLVEFVTTQIFHIESCVKLKVFLLI